MTAPTDPVLGFDFGLDFKSAPARLPGEGDRRLQNASRLLPYFIGFADDYLRGVTKHELVLLSAYPGVGKTEIATSIAAANAGEKRNVFVFALEAEPEEIERRLKYRVIARLAHEREHPHRHGLNYPDWYLGRYETKLRDLSREADQIIGDNLGGLHTYYRGRDFTGETIHRLCLAVQDKADLIVIDHLHYIDIDDERSENHEYAKLIKTIRDIVLLTGRPILLVVHLRKRQGGAYAPIVPPLEEIHGSSEIFKVATTAIMLSRAPVPTPAYHHAPTFISIPKWRIGGGCPFVALCTFDRRTNTYRDTYTLGRLSNNDREWTEIAIDADHTAPPWARRFKSSGVDGGLCVPVRPENGRNR